LFQILGKKLPFAWRRRKPSPASTLKGKAKADLDLVQQPEEADAEDDLEEDCKDRLKVEENGLNDVQDVGLNVVQVSQRPPTENCIETSEFIPNMVDLNLVEEKSESKLNFHGSASAFRTKM
jgi:hypothetical protein